MKALKILLILFILPMGNSCTKILNDFEFEDKDPKIVVQAKFNPDSTSLVFITRSLDMFDRREIKKISGATVRLTDAEGDSNLVLQDSAGWYSVPSGTVKSGNTYNLDIEADGFPVAHSAFTVPAIPVIEGVDTSKVYSLTGFYAGITLKGKFTLHIHDNPETEDYYSISMKKKLYQINWDDFGIETDTVIYYDYIPITSSSPYVDLAYYQWSGYVNFSPKSDIYGSKLIISDRLFNGSPEVSLDIFFIPEYNEIMNTEDFPDEYIDVYLTAIDKHLFEYASAKAEMNRVEDNPLAEPVTPYSSVEDGYGLVYGERSTRFPVNITGLFTLEDYQYTYYYGYR